MKPDKKRYLTHFHPEILEKKELPYNFEFTQFYAMDIKSDEDKDSPIDSQLEEDFFGIKISAYKTDRFGVFNTLGKPISKMIR